MFSIRGQLHILLTMIAGLMIAAIPVTVTFAQSYDYNANYSYNGSYSMPYGNSGYQQQYLYWCTGQGGGYYSYNPCPTYQQPMQPAYQVPAHHYTTYTRYSYYPSYQYYYPQQSYYYPSMYYGYNYGSYNYNYNYNYGGNWGYAW